MKFVGGALTLFGALGVAGNTGGLVYAQTPAASKALPTPADRSSATVFYAVGTLLSAGLLAGGLYLWRLR